jgi:hypothetical protein
MMIMPQRTGRIYSEDTGDRAVPEIPVGITKSKGHNVEF